MSLRDEILALAGEDKNTIAARTRRALDVVDETMNATKVWRSTHQGEVVEEREDIDTRARLEAADRALDMIGARVSKSASTQGPTGPTSVNVYIAGMSGPIQARAEVVDSEPATTQ